LQATNTLAYLVHKNAKTCLVPAFSRILMFQ
jgi:hypothetical protein